MKSKLPTMDLEIVKKYIQDSDPTSKIYLGADSERINIDGVWMVDIITVVIIHDCQKYGGKVFGQVERERDYDKILGKPFNRMMAEAYKLVELHTSLIEVLEGREVELHLDVNPDEAYGSSCAASSAAGYVKGVAGLDPVLKPNSWAATNVADRGKFLTSSFTKAH